MPGIGHIRSWIFDDPPLPVEPEEWILADGFWNDDGIWIDEETWIDE